MELCLLHLVHRSMLRFNSLYEIISLITFVLNMSILMWYAFLSECQVLMTNLSLGLKDAAFQLSFSFWYCGINTSLLPPKLPLYVTPVFADGRGRGPSNYYAVATPSPSNHATQNHCNGPTHPQLLWRRLHDHTPTSCSRLSFPNCHLRTILSHLSLLWLSGNFWTPSPIYWAHNPPNIWNKSPSVGLFYPPQLLLCSKNTTYGICTHPIVSHPWQFWRGWGYPSWWMAFSLTEGPTNLCRSQTSHVNQRRGLGARRPSHLSRILSPPIRLCQSEIRSYGRQRTHILCSVPSLLQQWCTLFIHHPGDQRLFHFSGASSLPSNCQPTVSTFTHRIIKSFRAISRENNKLLTKGGHLASVVHSTLEGELRYFRPG
jgi:hypothetical protein